MTPEEFRKAFAQKSRSPTARANKYHAKKSGGYASRKEHRRAIELQTLQRAGIITNLREQVAYQLIPPQHDTSGKLIERACSYIADFVYQDQQGNTIVEDTKGVRTDVYRIKRKLMLFRHGIIISER